jgi:hypothetical protein
MWSVEYSLNQYLVILSFFMTVYLFSFRQRLSNIIQCTYISYIVLNNQKRFICGEMFNTDCEEKDNIYVTVMLIAPLLYIQSITPRLRRNLKQVENILIVSCPVVMRLEKISYLYLQAQMSIYI